MIQWKQLLLRTFILLLLETVATIAWHLGAEYLGRLLSRSVSHHMVMAHSATTVAGCGSLPGSCGSTGVAAPHSHAPTVAGCGSPPRSCGRNGVATSDSHAAIMEALHGIHEAAAQMEMLLGMPWPLIFLLCSSVVAGTSRL